MPNNKKLITEKEIQGLILKGIRRLEISGNEIFTPAAKDKINEAKIKLDKVLPISQNFSQLNLSTPTFNSKKLAIGCDHTGFALKNLLIPILNKEGYEIIDIGINDESSCDYPDFALKVAEEVSQGKVSFGILIDATGIPSSITANKIPGIRAATCYNEFSARSSREHNNANILVLGAKAIGEETAKSILQVWLNSSFLGERHQKRLDKITEIEKKYSKN
ncbi:MAG: ribose 5-phosphate isomerase B [Ignavibacteriales bacterium]|nr:ribose 5-phosphate isomerase B [Ignavibacteriales bacterium]